MEDKTKAKELKGDLVRGLKQYFNNDIDKVKQFGAQLKSLGFDLDNYDTLVLMRSRSEALITLLGLSDFGSLESTVKAIEHLKGKGKPEEFKKHYVDIFSKPK